MSNLIYYFSGRGNSLKAAMDVSKKIDDFRLFPIRHNMLYPVINEGDTIGIFSPVIDLGIPAYVLNFIDQLKIPNKQTYIYAVVTNGGMPCAATEQIRKHLRKKDLTLSANFLLTFGIDRSAADQWLSRIDEIAEIIKHKQVHRTALTQTDKLLSLANSLAKRMIPSEDKKFIVGEECTGCGVCEKICPAKNIKITNGKPVWMHSCEQCSACFSWCPSAAISGTNLAARTHYTNSDITLDQMLV